MKSSMALQAITASLMISLYPRGDPALYGTVEKPYGANAKREPIDLSDFKKPVNGYQKKQRKAKSKRKSKRLTK